MNKHRVEIYYTAGGMSSLEDTVFFACKEDAEAAVEEFNEYCRQNAKDSRQFEAKYIG